MVAELVRVSVAEAAKLLGVSAQTVRRRIESGELKAESEVGGRGRGWRWMVLLPSSPQAAQAARSATSGPREPELVAELRARVSSLEAHLEQSERAASEMRQLLSVSQSLLQASSALIEASEERIRIAESPPIDVPESQPDVATKHRGIWARLLGDRRR